VSIEPMRVAIPDAELADLRQRLRWTRWPDPAPGPAWAFGSDNDYLRHLVAYWADEYDWRAAERRLNSYDHFRCELDDVVIHFVHARAATGHGIPLILTHGWPSTFAEFLPLADLLTDPGAHGLSGPSFDVVVPSLPGYCWSSRPRRPHTMSDTAALWHRLMRRLGYPRYAAHGGDLGSGVSTFLARQHPQALIGLHLNDLELAPDLGPGSPPLSPAEQAYVEREQAWEEIEGGYHAIQSTKPQTLAFALTDSPAGLAAWVAEKWRSWSDSQGDLDARIPREQLLTTLTLLWVTNSIAPSLRDFADNRGGQLGPTGPVRVPTAISMFSHEFVDPGTVPREWAERLYDIVSWRPQPRGGHFPAIEEPRLLAEAIATFFDQLTNGSTRSGSARPDRVPMP
jgi:pimeloyl-ACP methyl ester carboxylesterase